MHFRLLLLGLGLWLGSCQRETLPQSPAPGREPDPAPPSLTITYPFDEALFPPEIIAPTVRWTDTTQATLWRLDFQLPDGRSLTREVRTTQFRPDAALWKDLKSASLDRPLTLSIQGTATPQGSTLSSASVRFATSSDPVGDSLFYREVILPFGTAVKDTRALRWRFGTISQEDQPPVVLTDLPVCGNCHSFSRDGSVLGMDVDYANDKGSYAMVETAPQMSLSPDRVITWKDLDPKDDTRTFGLLPQVSPDGRFVMATVKDRSIFVGVDDNLAYSQLFFPVKGVLGWYDRQEKKFGTLPGANDPAFVQSNPSWSPDGKELIFARAPKYDITHLQNRGIQVLSPIDCPVFFGGGQKFRFDLFRIPFGGGAGGQAVPLEGASNNGKSNYFPRFSPDGKWLVFCQADSFMLLQPDAALYIMPAAGGTPRRLRANRDSMNSWHSWSSNGRWLVFTSKLNGPYSQLFLTHIDQYGVDSPPVLLENFTTPDRAANIPEFVALPPDRIKKIEAAFLDSAAYFQGALGMLPQTPEGATPEDLNKALELLATALKMDPTNAHILNEYGRRLASLDRYAEAAAQFQEAIRLHPAEGEAYLNLGLLH